MADVPAVARERRVARRALPLVFPVNVAPDGQVLVVRTSPGTKLSTADHANVVFEVDQRTRSGWSVVVRCLADEVTAAHRGDLVARTRAAGADVDPRAYR